MNITLLKKFNNYYNRIILKFDTFAEYTSAYTYKTLTNIDFDPKDGVDTEQIFNWSENYTPDYILVTEQVGSANATTTEIRSRWFVIEWTRVRGKQYKATLHRDVIADNYENILRNPAFIEKGSLDKEDVSIFNKEDMSFNQIKADEFLLRDETQCPWVVGYVAKQKPDGSLLPSAAWNDVNIPNADATDAHVSEEYDTWEDFWDAHPTYDKGFDVVDYFEYSVKLDVCYMNLLSTYDQGITVTKNSQTGKVTYKESAFDNNRFLHGLNSTVGYFQRWIWKAWIEDARQLASNSLMKNFNSSVLSSLQTELSNKLNANFVDKNNNDLKSYLNYIKTEPVVKIGSRFFKLKDSVGTSKKDFLNCTYGSTAFYLFDNNLNREPTGISGHDVISGTAGSDTYRADYSYQHHELVAEEIFAQVKIKNIGTPTILHDAPYYMFAIPYSDDLTLYSGGSSTEDIHCEKTMKSIALSAAQNLAAQAGAGAIYDVQLLPYCPVREVIKTKFVPEGDIHEFLSDHGTYHTIIRRSRPSKKKPLLNHKYYATLEAVLEQEEDVKLITLPNGISVTVHKPDISPIKFTATELHINHLAHNVAIYNHLHELLIEIPEEELEDYDTVVEFELFNSLDDNFSVYNNSTIVALKDITDPGYFSYVDVGEVEHTDIVTEVDGGQDRILSTILWCSKSQFSFNINLVDNYLITKDAYYLNKFTGAFKESLEIGYDNIDVKVKNQCDMLRLCSPNYSNFFDLNIQMNKGVTFFNVDCTYKPYQPYIHLNPDFGGLYGRDYNDIRGLVCGGDFSIALTSDAWSTYQLQNKNYMAAFDRNMQVLETQNNIQHQSDVVGAIAGTFQGAASGAMAGAMMGVGYGAIAGAVVGGATSAIGGVADVQNNDIMRNLNMTNMKDQFGYQLDNIKALPQGLSKTSAFTNNNKLFPFIEYYTCSEIEKQALKDKIEYNGMTIMRIGKIENFKEADRLTFIKGKLIRTDVIDDFHMVAVINDELQKGVYL